ncbi:MAG: L-threonylcarbamoyladenylate synthase [Halanaerobiaceae bacterium]
MDYRTEVKKIEFNFLKNYYQYSLQKEGGEEGSLSGQSRRLFAAENKEYKFLLDNEVIGFGAELLQKGEIVAFPTETVYGLGADATRREAVKKIFAAKGRPVDNPLIVHISEKDQLNRVVEGILPSGADGLMEEFWPGPLTLILNRGQGITDTVTAGLETVAVRMPRHPVARALITVSGLPLAAPSANSSGFPSPTRAEHVLQDLEGGIPLVIDGGPCPVGVESTVVDLTAASPEILRPGGVPREEIEVALGRQVSVNVSGEKGRPSSPGMKYRHYAPQTPVYLFATGDLAAAEKIREDNLEKKIVFVLTAETAEEVANLPGVGVRILAEREDLETAARRLFWLLRELDEEDYDLVAVEAVPRHGLGEAIMNRLHKAAHNDIYLK